MVVTHLIGGLGNQMFQFAAARAVSIKYKTSLKLDISSFANYDLHQGFELKRIFNCTTGIASKADLRGVLGWQSSTLAHRILLRPSMAAFRSKKFVVEPHIDYWCGINELIDDCYIYGYWQSEKYFIDIATQIREDFTFKQPMANHNAKLAEQINQVNSVSLHVRRGDYANNPKTTAIHGLISLEYYQAAVKHVVEQVQQPHFFIFSVDIAWVRENLKIDFPHQYIDHNTGAESYNDMRLMSLCKHHIIANSSFSWWGAWLNRNPEKLVIAPKNWFTHSTDVKDLLPQNWVKL